MCPEYAWAVRERTSASDTNCKPEGAARSNEAGLSPAQSRVKLSPRMDFSIRMGTQVTLPLIAVYLVQVCYRVSTVLVSYFGNRQKLWHKFCSAVTKMLLFTLPYDFMFWAIYSEYQTLKPGTNNITETTAPVRAAEPDSTAAFKQSFSISKLCDGFLDCIRLKHSRSGVYAMLNCYWLQNVIQSIVFCQFELYTFVMIFALKNTHLKLSVPNRPDAALQK